MIWGVTAADQLYGGDGNDWIMGNGGADIIEGGLGNDYITGLGAGAQAKGGDGDDIITAASAEDVYIFGALNGAIPGISENIIWADMRQYWTMSHDTPTLDANGNLSLSYSGGITLGAVYSGASALGGGWTYQFSVGVGALNLKYYHPALAPQGKVPAQILYHEIVSGYPLASAVYLAGDAGADLLVGNTGDDILDGGNGNDLLLGYGGNDQLAGADGDDLLFPVLASDGLIYLAIDNYQMFYANFNSGGSMMTPSRPRFAPHWTPRPSR